MSNIDETAIKVRALRKSFNDTLVLNGIDLDVRDGETLVILGGSGSGKSTLLRCMVGLETPDAGSVEIQGVDVFGSDTSTLAGLRRRMGMAFQGGALFGSMTVAENVELHAAGRGADQAGHGRPRGRHGQAAVGVERRDA
jgi:phospholipid/cholesterol/gamma-HCH transport system ATP-binding protein